MPMEANPIETNPQAKCHFCDECDGHGCVSELPGMGGAYDNENFIRNHADWDAFADGKSAPIPAIRLAPITGAVQNVGYHDEKSFYLDIMGACALAGIRLSAGDGYPDEKLKFGIEALTSLGRKGAVFIKPYENRVIFERMEWASRVAEIVGVDIDSYAILTMRNLVNLQRKTASDLLAIKSRAGRDGLPFAIKGVFRPEDIELVREVKPDIVVVSNHGGRVETLRGSTVSFLAERGDELARYAGAVWVDGGIRTRHHLETAASLGASEVMIGRPLITALLRGGADGVRSRVERILA
jgi:isopentenyl diphosphate isomerase/L-lactate dehydrogenase-like FMN-dependent dehydrogenase